MSDNNPPADHVMSDNNDSGVPLEENIKSRSTWLRLLFMLVYYVIATVTSAVLSVVVVLSFCWVLFTGEKNGQLQQAGRVIAAYLYEIIRYLTFNTEDKPFPFGNELPSADVEN
jgi:flagellar basal body-associated protein FliL